MKNLIIIIAACFMIPFMATANNQNGDPPTDPIRVKRNMAITISTGFNHLAGAGLKGKYYLSPKIGIDAGAGFGLKGLKIGVQGRYLLSEKKLSPFVGLGFSQKIGSGAFRLNQSLYGNSSDIIEIDFAKTSYGLLVAGWEYISSGGFVFGITTGYSLALTDPYRVISGNLEQFWRDYLDISQGSGFIFEMNMGYAF